MRLTLASIALSAGLGGAIAPAGAQDTSKVARDSARSRADSARGLFGQGSDLGLRLNARLESKLDRLQNDRCIASQFFNVTQQCRATFQPGFDFQFDVRTGGTVAERVLVDVDYDSKREFDASNRISLAYAGKPADWLQRLEVGNVSFAAPASRFITSGIPQGNYGIQAVAKLGTLQVRAIAAQQTGNVVRDLVFSVGGRTHQQADRDIEDYQVEPRRFFFTVDPRQFAGYPNIDILNAAQLRQLAASLPDSIRPVRVSLYRLLIGGQPRDPNGPQFRIIGDALSRRGQVYEPLRENVDYYVDPSQLWVMLAQPPNLNNERIVVAYTVRIGGRDTTIAGTGGTPDVTFTPAREQFAALLWDPRVAPGDPAFAREIRAAYRVGGDDVRRETVAVTILTGATAGQEKPLAGTARTFLELFGLAQPTNPSAFDVEHRLWPRRGDPVLALGGTAATRVVQDHFLVFPSLQPFARAGLAQPAANPANDEIYATPGEYLYSPLHPQSLYRIRVRYESEGGGDGARIPLPSTQIRPLSERLTLDDGTRLRRDADYVIDYDLGAVTFLRADTLFTRARNVTVRYEENPIVASVPTSIFGLASTLPLRFGEVNLLAIAQRQRSVFTRPPLGYEEQSALIAGVQGAFSWDAGPLARALRRLPGATPDAPARIRLDAEFATSRPQSGAKRQPYLESFEGTGGIEPTLGDPGWYFSGQPALGTRLAARIGGAEVLDLARAATLAWQNTGTTAANKDGVRVTLQQVDPLTQIVGAGLEQPEQVLWLTLYPLGIGGAYNDARGTYQWHIAGAPAGRRWRSIRQQLGASGVDMSRVETVQAWFQVDTAAARRARNPTFVIDVGDVSENSVAIAPAALAVQGTGATADTVFSGRVVTGRDTLQSERDAFSRAFNQDVNDTGLPGDRVPRLPFSSPDSSGVLRDFAMCSRGNVRLAKLGDTKTNCTVRNARLDEWDLDADNVLNLDATQREQERLFRFVVDLADPASWSRVGGCGPSAADTLGAAGPRLCWVQVKLPFGAPFETLNGGPSPLRVRAARLTMISGTALLADEFSQVPVAGLNFVGPPWTRRSDRAVIGIGGTRASSGFVSASVIGTQDRDSTRGLVYESPPGVIDEAEQQLTGLENQRIVVNERAMRLQATALAKYERAEAFYRFPEGPRNLMQYRELRAWARGRGNGWGAQGELQVFFKLGRDANNFYAYRVPANAGRGQATWNPEVRIEFERFYALQARLQDAYLHNRPDSIACTGVDSALVAQSALPAGQVTHRYAACANGYIVYTVDPAVTPPNLQSVHELAVGIVRVDSATGGATAILPGDTLEVWVNDIRLGDVVSTPGYAGQFAIEVATDLGTVRAGFAHRDAGFRQLAEAPPNVAADEASITAMVRLERFFPRALGWSLPLTVTHFSTSSAPLFLTRSDIRASGIAGLRTPRTSATAVSLTLRRATPVAGGWYAPIVNRLSATATANRGDSRTEFQAAGNTQVTAGVNYAIGGEGESVPMPAWWDRSLRALPSWLAGNEFVEALLGAKWRTQPATFTINSNMSKGDDHRTSYLKPAGSATDTARTVTGLSSVWRSGSALELKPFDALAARWEVSTLRDLRDYGDSSLAAATASDERSRLLGVDGGLERERVLNTSVSFTPALRGWLRPRFEYTSGYGLQRDPNTPLLLREGDTTGAFRLPRRVNGQRTVNAGAALDLARLLRAWVGDSAARARLDATFQPLDLTWSRTLTSAFDGTPFTPGLGFQFGLVGVDGFIRDHGRAATNAGSNEQVSLSLPVRLPLGLTLAARTQRVATRNWLRRADQSQAVVDGEQVTLPDLTLRASYSPRALEGLVTSIGGSARFMLTRQRLVVPGGSALVPGDVRTGRVLSYPLGANILFNDAGRLAVSFNVTSTFRLDSLPGSVADSRAHEVSADVSRAFRLPPDWETKGDLRTRVSFQQARATSHVRSDLVPGAQSRLADNGRRAVTFNADTDVAENMNFSLQGARIVTFDHNLSRQLTQTVFSAVLQLRFFAGELR